MYDILKAKNGGTKDEVIEFAQALVQCPSSSLGEGQAAALVLERMKALGYDKAFRDAAGNVVGLLLGREAAPTVLLNGHVDTVPPLDGDAWGGSPYSGRIDAGRLHGLGAADCKGGIAAQVYAGALLKRSLLPLNGNVIVAVTVAEENGRSVGVRALMAETLDDLDMKADYAILGEPTDLGLYYGHDGWAEIDVRVEGANPFHVDDATKAIVDDFRVHDTDRIADPLECIAVHSPRFEDRDGRRRATIRVARRLTVADKAREVLSRMKYDAARAADAAGCVAVDVAVRQENQRLYTGRTTMVRHITHAWATDPFHPLMERARHALTAAGCDVRPGKWQLGRLGMGTAGSTLVEEFGIPTIGYGPGHEDMAHACGESVEVRKVVECVYGTAAIVHALIGMPVFGWTGGGM